MTAPFSKDSCIQKDGYLIVLKSLHSETLMPRDDLIMPKVLRSFMFLVVFNFNFDKTKCSLTRVNCVSSGRMYYLHFAVVIHFTILMGSADHYVLHMTDMPDQYFDVIADHIYEEGNRSIR